MTAGPPAPQTSIDHTVDAFHRGAFHVCQPRGKGHRSGMDAMMLAAAVPVDFQGTLVDLGAGAGTAGLAVLARCPGAAAVLAERDVHMLGLARATLDLDGNRDLARRARVLEADVSLTGKARVAAGLGDASFDYVILNPPFNLESDRPTPDALRRDAHVMSSATLESWLRTASAILRPGGGVALIARPVSLDALLVSLKGRFGALQIVPVHPRAHEAAIRIIIRGRRGSRRALELCPPLVLHGETGNGHSPRAVRVCNGQESLFGD